jgi:hypothetical protein
MLDRVHADSLRRPAMMYYVCDLVANDTSQADFNRAKGGFPKNR